MGNDAMEASRVISQGSCYIERAQEAHFGMPCQRNLQSLQKMLSPRSVILISEIRFPSGINFF